MSTILLDADGFQVASWDVPLAWTPDDDLPPSDDFDIEPDWDAAFDRPYPEDHAWWAQECDRMERSGLKPEPFEPTDADWDDMARWCEWVEMKDLESLYTDEDTQAAGLAVG
jgi:hypothetical protein